MARSLSGPKISYLQKTLIVFKRKKKTDCLRAIWLIVTVLVLANLLVRGPDLLKFLTPPRDKWYVGHASWFDPWDINVYASAIGWGKRDGLLLENPYDSQSNQKMLVHTFYSLIGKITSPLNLPNILTFHLAGVVTSSFLVMVVWWLLSIFFQKERAKKLSFVLLLLGGGLGWLFFPFLFSPDITVPGFTLANALRRPHEAISLSLFLITISSFWQGTIQPKKELLLLGTASSCLMLFFHAYSLLTLGIILLSFGFYWWKKTNSLAFWKPFLITVLEAGIYYFLVARPLLTNPSFSGMGSLVRFSLFPSIFKSPNPILAIIGWGLLFPFIIIAFRIKKKDYPLTFLKIWFVSHWLVIYFPLDFQKLMLRGLWVPAVILAIKGLEEMAQEKKYHYHFLATLLLIFALPYNFLMNAPRTIGTLNYRWCYLTKQEGEIIDYLKTHGEDGESVLASYRVSNLIPAHTSKRVWAGHGAFTPQFQDRLVEIERFFKGDMEEPEVKSFLEKTKANWVFWGPDEKDSALIFPYLDLVEPVIETKIASLYRVIE